MQDLEQAVKSGPRANSGKAALAALVLAAAGVAGCAQAPIAHDTAAGSPAATPALARFDTCAKPVYPAEALAKRVEGTVTLRFMIEPDGRVSQSLVQKSSGDASLDEAARVAIAKCSFTPATVNGKAQAAWVPVQYVWTI